MDISLKKLEVILRRETKMWKRIPEMRGTRKETALGLKTRIVFLL